MWSRTQLLTFLEEFKDKMVRRTTEVTREVDELVYDVKVRRSSLYPRLPPLHGLPDGCSSPANSVQTTDVGVQNALNQFNMLSNTQFIENRVADDEDQDWREGTPGPAAPSADTRAARVVAWVVARVLVLTLVLRPR